MKTKNTIGLIIYTEDSHDIFLISILSAIKSQDVVVFCFLPRQKKKRLFDYIKSDIPLYSWVMSNVSFVDLYFLSSNDIAKNKYLDYLLINIRRAYKFLKFSFSYIGIITFLMKKKPDLKWNFVALENYSKLSEKYISSLINRLEKHLNQIGIVIHNTDSPIQTKDLISKFNKCYVLSSDLTNYVPVIFTENISVLPFSTPTEYTIYKRLTSVSNNDKNESVINLVVTGEVSNNRRDYNTILHFLKRIKEPFNITFLGKVTEKSILANAKTLGINLISFERYINQQEFDSIMASADLIIYKSSVKKKYTKIKASGVIFDSMRYGVPIISLEILENEFKYSPSIHYIDLEKSDQIRHIQLSNYLVDREKSVQNMNLSMKYLNEIIRNELIYQ
jgi:hypothetical protein